MELPQDELDALRRPLLAPFGHTFEATNRVSLVLFADGSWVVENFNDEAVTVALDGVEMNVAGRGRRYHWRTP